jgi:hypothetical protein
MNKANIFLQIYNELDDWLRKQVNMDKNSSFNQVINEATRRNIAVMHYKNFLKKMAELRNVIIHDSSYPPEIIATPNDETVNKFTNIFKQLTSPPKLYSISSKVDKIFTIDDKLEDILIYMTDNDYSQVIVYGEKRYHLITGESITIWLGNKIHEDILSIKETILESLLDVDIEKSWKFVSQTTDVFEAIKHFESINNRIQALAINPSGKNHEKPTYICTAWDIVRKFNQDVFL